MRRYPCPIVTAMPLTVFLLVILSAFLHASWNFAAKKAAGNFSVIYLSLWIACLAFLPFLFALAPKEIFNAKALRYVFATGTIHAVYFFALAKAYEHGDISSSYPIARGTGVAGTALAASALLNENIAELAIAGIMAVSVGTLSIGLRRRSSTGFFKGLFFSVLVGATIVAYSIVDKLGVGIMHPAAYIYGLFLIAALWLTPYAFFFKRLELIAAWNNYKGYGFIIGLGSLATYLLILFVYRLAPVSYVAALRELSVAIGAFMGCIFLKEKLTAAKMAGILFIILGMIAIKMA